MFGVCASFGCVQEGGLYRMAMSVCWNLEYVGGGGGWLLKFVNAGLFYRLWWDNTLRAKNAMPKLAYN